MSRSLKRLLLIGLWSAAIAALTATLTLGWLTELFDPHRTHHAVLRTYILGFGVSAAIFVIAFIAGFLALIDFTDKDDAFRDPPPPSVSPMNASLFVTTLRPRVEELLLEAAAAINDAPPGRIVPDSRDRVRGLLQQLELEAVETGLRLRIEASYATLPPQERPHGDWASRYRRMRTAGEN